MNHDPHNSISILVVDDDAAQRSLLKSFLTQQGFTITTAASGEAALEAIQQQLPGMVISDIQMPGLSGLELQRAIHEGYPGLPMLLVTAYADVRDAVGAIRDGAVNYLEKPIDLDELLSSVRQAVGIPDPLTPVISEHRELPKGVIARSPGMVEVFRNVALVAPSETRVLITGASGAGKEIVANTIHAWSARSAAPFVKVNCASIPENLIESELFGHEKGAFTGANTARTGLFEQARGGTIFLDEIGEMPIQLQAKLLRITQDGSFKKVGGNRELFTDARIIAATNRDLESEVQEGRFRDDLFYRLNVMEIYVPALAERTADIVPLAIQFGKEFVRGNPHFSPHAYACLEAYEWPGNVRELRNAIERAALLSRGDVILPEHLPKQIQQHGQESAEASTASTKNKSMLEVERTAILQALQDNAYNRTETARALGISRRTLTYKIRSYREQGYAIDPE